MYQHILEWAAWILSRLAPRGESEALVGDLLEEYALRASAGQPSAALRWYLQQVLISGLYLLWIRLTRNAWLSTLGVALLAYIAVGIAEFVIRRMVSSSPAVSMIITFPAVVLIAYCAAGLRRGATVVLGAMMLLAVAIMTLTGNEQLSLWYRIAYFIVGPTAVFIGGAFHSAVARKMD